MSESKLTGPQLRALDRAARPITSKYYAGTVGVPNSLFDERSVAALERRSLVEPRVQTWTTPAGQELTAVFWIITDAGREAYAEYRRTIEGMR